MEKIIPFKCSKCGTQFEPSDGGQCEECLELFCLSHINRVVVYGKSLHLCTNCSNKHKATMTPKHSGLPMDTDSTKINYPIFLAGQYDYMLTVVSESDLNYHVEENDVEPGFPEYHGWDYKGRPISLYWKEDRVLAAYTSEQLDFDGLINSIMTYVRRFGGNLPETPADIKADPEALFKWADALVESHYQETRLFTRLRRWVKNLMHSDK